MMQHDISLKRISFGRLLVGWIVVVAAVSSSKYGVNGFSASSFLAGGSQYGSSTSSTGTGTGTGSSGGRLYSSINHEGDRSNLDRMRFLLEQSWNANTMGAVPTHPESAAEAAGMAISQAMQQQKGNDDNNNKVFLVDICLPSMDITLGPNVYDGISAIEFCNSMAQTLSRLNDVRSTILVRNQLSLNSIQTALSLKQKETEQQKQEEEEIVTKDTDNEMTIFDDFSDFDILSNTFENDFRVSTSKNHNNNNNNNNDDDDDDDIDLIKQQLMASYDSTENYDGEMDEVVVSTKKDSFRLASLFGNTVIQPGKQMMQQVIDAVKENVALSETENVIMILSPATQEEMIAVRKLISDYSSDKYIVLVNHKLNPMPKELFTAETVYSMLPLIANAKSSPVEQPNPKIVLMRRYPQEWEIFIAIQNNMEFELAASIPAHSVGKRGPSMEIIADCVKQFMTIKNNNQ